MRPPAETAAALLMVFGRVLHAAASIAVDGSLPDGVYEAQRDPSNPSAVVRKRFVTGDPENDFYYRSRNLREALPIAKGRLFCRSPSDAPRNKEKGDGVRSNRTFSLDDYHAAVNALFDSPLFWVPGSFARYALHGSAVVYVCNLSGKPNSASLLEFASAMAEADGQCGGQDRAAKRTMANWRKWYGRDARGFEICTLEPEGAKHGIPNDLMWWQDRGCRNYVNGVRRADGEAGECNDNAAGEGVYQRLRTKFPWYKPYLSHKAEDKEKKGEKDQDAESDNAL